MAVESTDLVLHKAATNDDTGSNGGKENFSNTIVSATLNNLFPNVTNSERIAGKTRYRKMFLRNNDANDLKFELTKFWIDCLSSAADRFLMVLGNYSDAQSDAINYDGGETWSGTLTGSLSVGDAVTGATSGATGTILAISGSSVRILVLSVTQFSTGEKVELDASNYFTVSGSGSYRDGYLGTGRLNSAITTGGASLTVDFNTTDMKGVLRIGASILITDKETVDDSGHNSEWVTIDTITWAGAIATIGITGTFTNSYAVSYVGTGGITFYTRIAAYLNIGNLEPTVDNIVTSGLPTGDYTGTIQNHAEGGVEDSITITFTSSSAFDVTGTNVASYGSGTTGSDFSPTNAATSTPYFTLPSSGWSGTFSAGDTLTFDTHPSSQAIWVKEIVPASTPSYANNSVWMAVSGESALLTTTTTTTSTTTTTT